MVRTLHLPTVLVLAWWHTNAQVPSFWNCGCFLVVDGFAAARPPRPPRIRPRKPSTASGSSSSSSSNRNHGEEEEDDDDAKEPRRRRHEQALQDPTLLSTVPFSQRSDIHPATQRALIEGMGLQTMTQIQAQIYGPALEGTSIMACSKTGSGKTLAFLLPSLERLLQRDLDLYRPGRSIGAIILSPTRELAIQIADEAERLLMYHSKSSGLSVSCLYGGVKMQRDIRLLGGGSSPPRLPTVLVSTPGRLLEHLERNTRIERWKFADIVDETKIVVLDETDRLWQGHRHETKKILSFLARAEKRQTLLFSATFPRSIRRLLKESVLKGQDHVMEVDCIEKSDSKRNGKRSPSESIAQRIQQSFVVLNDMSQYVSLLLTIIRREQQLRKNDYKILVFFPASRLARFFHQFFTLGDACSGSAAANNDPADNLWEIHSRMSQSSRARASNSFRNARRGVLFSSDVSARGLDYPDITLVVQLGAPASMQDYTHRIGRTGRAGQAGKCILVLLPFENQMKDIICGKESIEEDRELSMWLRGDGDEGFSSKFPSLLEICQDDLESTLMKIKSGHKSLTPSAEAAYKAFLVHYASKGTSSKGKKSSDTAPSGILEYAAGFANATGLAGVPELDATVASRIGL